MEYCHDGWIEKAKVGRNKYRSILILHVCVEHLEDDVFERKGYLETVCHSNRSSIYPKA